MIAIIVIIVVLVVAMPAVLYLMVLGFGGTSTATPTATYSSARMTSGWQVNVVAISQNDVAWDDIEVMLDDGKDIAGWETATSDLDGGSKVTHDYGSRPLGALDVTLTVADVSGNGHVSSSDYFWLTAAGGLAMGTVYTAVLVYEPTGERIGTGITFIG